MVELRIRMETVGPTIPEEFDRIAAAFPKCATGTMREVGDNLKVRGRANIAGAGFGSKWQNAWRVQTFPRSGESSSPAVFARHNIPYAGVFEEGAVISGKPLLWIPLPNVPKSIGGKRTTAARWAKTVGPLFMIKGHKHPVLIGKPIGGTRKGNVPLFVGLSSVTIGKKFDLDGVTRRVADGIPAIFQARLEGTL